ncbi:hypothetical protein [Polluticoccus soli]|uniref:hypothetical protein n=1 Tax=Polluticoccus soli TaxID=3034150 RepID=UPI0023E0A93E|nr:hypothetical protein [Flavipsychrobacter sp. JY13-12]
MIKRTSQALTAALGFALLLSVQACKKVASDDLKDTVPYHQQYIVDYNKNTNKTSASAQFRVRDASGSKVDLNNGAGVTANSKSPSALQLVPGVYSWTFDGLVDVNFELTKNSGKKLVNSVAKRDIGEIAFPSSFPTAVSKSSGFTFNWAGDGLASGETLTVKITGTPSSASIDPNIEKTVTSGQVTISPSDLEKFAPGTITVSMERRKNLVLDVNDDTSNGDIEMTIKTEKETTLN